MTNLATLPVPGPLPAACVRLPHPLLCLGFIGLLLLNPMSAPDVRPIPQPRPGQRSGCRARSGTARATNNSKGAIHRARDRPQPRGRRPQPRPHPPCSPCPFSKPTSITPSPSPSASSRDPRINEASGIVASRRYPGLYYTHNDSGDEARVFLLDRHARTPRGRPSAQTRSTSIARTSPWLRERSPAFGNVCPGRHRRQLRPPLRNHDLPLPGAQPAARSPRQPECERAPRPRPARFDLAAPVLTTDTTAYRCKYPDPPSDAEGFAVHPRTGDGYIFTKRMDGRCFIYKLAAPWHPDALTVVPRLTILESPGGPGLAQAITAADISPDGRRLALRCYTGGWEYRLPAGTPDTRFESIFKQVPDALELPLEPQGEALGYEADGRGLVLISENGPRNQPPTLWQVPRRASGWRSPGIEAKNRP